ncbi:T9SS type A sorting domain-containing protein [Porphyromonas endodontalis]|uniref:T9SS type A sorting domain-containing protein n=1 Tax=Porphyromonas endodontalis TaxID=28124 RepID=UPI0028ECB085|nr:T9SS type A sorting domain-containing protein [Porphyromonas endodontalis]
MKLKHLMGVLLVLLLGSGIAKAQTKYGFTICGVEVNSGNVKKLNEIKGVSVGGSGHITYSPETNTLSIKNVSMQPEGGENCLHVYSAYKNLPFTLHLEGKNQFNSTNATAFWTECDTRIEGSGELFIRTKKCGIFVSNNATLTIEDCSLEIVSETDGDGRAGIDGLWDTQPKLVIKNASIYAKATGSDDRAYPYAIGGFESISIERSVITQPSNAEIGSYTFSYTKQFIMYRNKPATEVRIDRKSDLYNFSICGVAVTKKNADKLDKISGVSIEDGGYITYSPESNTLKIKDVALKAKTTGYCIHISDRYKALPFILQIEGDNQFNSPKYAPIYTRADMNIEGTGKLSISTGSLGISVAVDVTLTIEDCSIDIVSDSDEENCAGITGHWDCLDHLVIKNASIYAKASGKEDVPYPYAIGGFESIKLEGVTITYPNNAEKGNYSFDWGGYTETKQFVMSDGKPATEVKIMKTLAVEEVDVADLHVYPNPATHYVQVEGAKAGASIALYSLEGIRLLAAEANEAGAVELDLTTLPAGNYVVKAGGKHLKLSVKH